MSAQAHHTLICSVYFGTEEEGRVFYQDLLSSLGRGSETEKRPQKVECSKVGDETGGLDLKKAERVEKVWARLPGLLAGMACG